MLFCALWTVLGVAAELPAMRCDRVEYGVKTAYSDWYGCRIDGADIQMCVKYISNGKNPMLALLFRPVENGLYASMAEFIDAVGHDESGFLNPNVMRLKLTGEVEWALSNEVNSELTAIYVNYEWDNDAEMRVAIFMIPLNLMVSEESKWKLKKSKLLLENICAGRIDGMEWSFGSLRRKNELKVLDIPFPENFAEVVDGLVKLHKTTK